MRCKQYPCCGVVRRSSSSGPFGGLRFADISESWEQRFPFESCRIMYLLMMVIFSKFWMLNAVFLEYGMNKQGRCFSFTSSIDVDIDILISFHFCGLKIWEFEIRKLQEVQELVLMHNGRDIRKKRYRG